MKIRILKDSKNDLKELTDFLDKHNRTNYHVENNKVIYRGDLDLHKCRLTSLPESFGNLRVGGRLYLDGNQLTALPESFGNLKTGGSLYLGYNQLTAVPESFGNLKVGGKIDLSGNKFMNFPKSIINISPDEIFIEDRYEKQIQNMREWYEE